MKLSNKNGFLVIMNYNKKKVTKDQISN